jgi:hypothetical protein
MITTTKNDLEIAFQTWDERYRKNPEQFQNEVERLLRGTPKTYGEAAAAYFVSLLEELRP